MVVQHEVMEQRLEAKEPPLMVMMKMLFVRAEELRWPLSLFLSIVGTGPEVADVARRRSLPSNPPARAPSRRGPTSSFDLGPPRAASSERSVFSPRSRSILSLPPIAGSPHHKVR